MFMLTMLCLNASYFVLCFMFVYLSVWLAGWVVGSFASRLRLPLQVVYDYVYACLPFACLFVRWLSTGRLFEFLKNLKKISLCSCYLLL